MNAASPCLPAALRQTIAALPALADLENDTLARLGRTARRLEAPAGTVLFDPGSACENFLIVLSGTVKTFITGESGREIVLYRVETGQTCVLTTSCLLAGADYDTEGVAETDVVALAIPRPVFLEVLSASDRFRTLAFATFSERLRDLIVLINEISFGHLDQRLAAYLVAAANNGVLNATHNAIASDLGSAREAVSRLLKEFERQGLIETGRSRITLKSQEKLLAYGKSADAL